MLIAKLEDTRGLYHAITSGRVGRVGVRENLRTLGDILARQTRQIVTREMPTARRILCAVILRGGAMLYPGFLSEFVDADFCMMGLQRAENGSGAVSCTYCSPLEHTSYDLAIYIDCVAATGATILEARRHLWSRCSVAHGFAALVCSSELALLTLGESGFGVAGFSLNEDLKGRVVAPDFGELDAGHLFGTARQGFNVEAPLHRAPPAMFEEQPGHLLI